MGLVLSPPVTAYNFARQHLSTGEKDSGLVAQLEAGLDSYNVATSGVADQRAYFVKIDDDAGQLLAGLSGWTWGPCAGISLVWVREDSRRTGCGGRLLAAAEDVVRGRGCNRVFVSSFSFQAPRFYERHGFVECARVENYPLDATSDVYLVKQL